MSYIIIFILIIVIHQKNNYIEKLEKEIFLLKKQLKNITSNTVDLVSDTLLKIENSVSNTTVNDSTYISPKTNNNEIEEKNTSILITGSILIVLAAIVFLTTAWNSIPNILKTICLFLFVGIFLGASKIAKNKFKLEKASNTFFYIAMSYIPICILSISFFGLMGDYLSIYGDGKYLYLCISTIFLAILYYLVSKKTNNNYLIYGSILSQLLSVILFTLLFEENIFLVSINLLLYNILLILLTKSKIFNKIYSIIPIIISLITLLQTFETTPFAILTYLLITINFLYLEFKETHFVKSFVFNFYLLILGANLFKLEILNLTTQSQQLLFTFYILITFFLQHLLFTSSKSKKNLLSSCQILCCTAILFTYISNIFIETTIPSFIIGFIFILLLVLSYSNSKQCLYKYIAYGFINILLIDVNHTIFNNSMLSYFIPMITTVGIIYFEKLYPNLDDNFLPIYLSISESISLLCISSLYTEVSTILAIAFAIYIIIYNTKINNNQFYNIIPLSFVLPSIIDGRLTSELQLGIMLLLSVGITFASLYKGFANIYTIFSGIYLCLTFINIDNTYLFEILLLTWSTAHLYFLKSEQEKDIFKVLTAIFSNMLYYTIANDLNILSHTVFYMLGVIVAGMYIFRNIIHKYLNNSDTLEYLFWTVIYLTAFFQYTSPSDGIIFSLLILGIMFFSYTKKYGATFLASIIAILVNAFGLTKEFWFSIPWWIYLLVIGITLIGFAIKNEVNENKNKLSIGKVLKTIKDNCEK